MIELGNQQDYWNSRAQHWSILSTPLLPDERDVDFMRRNTRPGSDTLILGVTPELCTMALEASDTVTAVDFAQDMIDALRVESVTYACADWSEYLTQNTQKFDTIITDGGLTCLEFPVGWQQLANSVAARLKPEGNFAARVFMSTGEPPKDSYENSSLERFVTSMGNVDANWMVHPQHGDYKQYDVRYAFPPETEVLRMFGQFALHDKRIPDYEEGERFVSYAWQLP